MSCLGDLRYDRGAAVDTASKSSTSFNERHHCIADYATLFENTSKSLISDFKVSFLKEIVSKTNLMIEKSFKIGQIV